MQNGPLSSNMKIIIIVVAVIVVLSLLAVLLTSIFTPMGTWTRIGFDTMVKNH